MIYTIAFSIGVIAGLRTMTAPAAVSWAAYLGVIDLSDTWLAFLGYTYTPWVLSAFAIVELIVDQLPSTPSRKVPVQFTARMLSGALSGAAIGAADGALWVGLILGIAGAVAGTLGGAAARARLAAAFNNDRLAAIIEDAVAIGAALMLMALLA